MAEEIGLKIAVQGDREFQTQLSNVRKELKLTDSELDKLTALFADNGKSMEALKSKSEVYSRQIELQNQKVEAARKALENWNSVQKNAGAEADRLKGELQKAREEMARMEQATGTTTEELEEQKKKIAGLQEELSGAEKAYETAGKRTQDWQLSLNRAETDLLKTENALKSTSDEMGKLGGQTKTAGQKIDEFAKAAERCGDKIKSIGSKTAEIGKGMSQYVTAPLVGAATVAVAAMNDVDNGLDTIATKTGATGSAMNDLRDVFENVASEIPADFADIGAAVGEINTRLDFTGSALETATKSFLKFAKVNDMDVNSSVQLVSRAMGDAGIAAENYQSVLDSLTVAGQKSGISVDKLAESLAKYGAPLRALGIDTQDAIAMFAGWEKAGVNTEIAFSGMKKAISNWGKEGKDARAEFSKTLEEIERCPDIASATALAIETFGSKAGPDLADAIKGGRFAFEDYVAALQRGGGTVERTYGMIVDEVDDTQLAVQNCKIALHDMGETIAKSLGPVLLKGSKWVKEIAQKFDSLSDSEKETILKTAALVAALGPLLSATGKVATGIGSLTKGFGTAVSGTKDFIQGLRGIPTAAGETVSAAGKLGSALATVGGGPILLGIAAVTAAIAGIAWAVSEANKKGEEMRQAYCDAVVGISESFDSFGQDVESAQGILSNFDLSTVFSPEKQAEIENGVRSSQEKIMEIAQHAAEESRQLTEEEQKQIQELVKQIDSYIGEKLQAYRTQQSVVLEMAKSETEITRETAANILKSAEDTKNQTISIAKVSRDEKIAQAVKMRDDLKTIDAEQFQRMKKQAIEEYELQVRNAEKISADTYQVVASGYEKEYTASKKQLDDFKSLLDERREKQEEYKLFQQQLSKENDAERAAHMGSLYEMESELTELDYRIQESAGNMDQEFTGALLNMLLTMKEQGGNLTEAQLQTVQTIMDIYATLPPDMRTKADESMKELGLGFDENGDLVYTAAEGAKQRVMDALNSLPDDLNALGRAAATSLADALQNGNEQVRAAAQGLISQINAGGDVPGMLENATLMAQYYRDGYTGSLNAGASDAYKAGRQFTESSVRGGQAGIDSHSPSRATQKLGRYFGQGYQLGITEELHKTAELGKKLAQAALPRLESGMRIPSVLSDSLKPPKTESAAMAGTAYQPKTPQTTRIIINLDGRQIGEAVAPTVSRTIQAQASAIARGRGNPLV